jgi:hypothetical protein
MKKRIRLTTILPAFIVCLIFISMGCQKTKSDANKEETTLTESIVEIKADGYTLELPDSIKSGWNTIRLNNENGHEIHELAIMVLPEDKSFSDYQNEVMPAWAEGSRAFMEGEITDAAGFYGLAGKMLPEWFEMDGFGARTLASPGRSTRNHFYFEPGTYVIECWVKAPGGEPHIMLGMLGELTVTEESTDLTAPDVDVELSFTGDKILTDGDLETGHQTIALRLGDDSKHENIQLIKLDDETGDLATVATWLDWFSDGGLEAPAPADFLGGFHAYGIPQKDNSVYFTVENLEPGQYAWILEAPAEKEMWKTFAVE